MIDETGNLYGTLLVIEPAQLPNRNKRGWKCICQNCGAEKICSSSDLRSGKYSSCGASGCRGVTTAEDLTGRTFHFLKVICKDPTPPIQFPDRMTHWICSCERCGNRKSISTRNLKNGTTKSCGCLSSYGETVIANLLKQHDYSFKQQFKFDDLISQFSNQKLRFDFAVFNKKDELLLLIEFQGSQHYDPNNKFYTMAKGKTFEECQQRDQQKVDYCRDNQIPLIIYNNDNDYDSMETKLFSVIKQIERGDYRDEIFIINRRG